MHEIVIHSHARLQTASKPLKISMPSSRLDQMLKPESNLVGRQVMKRICRMISTKSEVLRNRTSTIRTLVSHARQRSPKVTICIHRAIVRGIHIPCGEVRVGGVIQDGTEETVHVEQEESGIKVLVAGGQDHDFQPAVEVDNVGFPILGYSYSFVYSHGTSVDWRQVHDEEVADSEIIQLEHTSEGLHIETSSEGVSTCSRTAWY